MEFIYKTYPVFIIVKHIDFEEDLNELAKQITRKILCCCRYDWFTIGYEINDYDSDTFEEYRGFILLAYCGMFLPEVKKRVEVMKITRESVFEAVKTTLQHMKEIKEEE